MSFMMSDMLKERRMGKGQDDSGSKSGDSHSADQVDDRCIYLSEDEQKAAMGSAKPGEEITLQVTGRMGQDGKFEVTSAMPAGMDDAGPEEPPMPPQGQPPMGMAA